MRLALLSALLLTACTADVMPAEVRSRITDDLGNVLRESQGTPVPGSAALAFLSITPAAIDPEASVKFLDERVFSDANFLGGDLYRLPPELLCVDGDATCAAQIAKAGGRLRVTAPSDGLHVYVQLGDGHDEPVELVLTHTTASLTIDLDDGDAAMTAIALALGETAPHAKVSGQVTAKLDVTGGAHASLTIDRGLSIAFADQDAPLDGDNAVRLAMAPGSIELDRDGIHATLGATTAHVAHADLTLSPVVATAITANALDTITGSFALQITSPQGLPPYSIAGLAFNGALQSSADQLEVLAGTLALATNPDTYGFLAGVGQCLSAVEMYDSSNLAPYTQFSIVDCR